MLSVADKKETNVHSPDKAPANRAAPASEHMLVLCCAEQRYAIPLPAVREILPLPLLSQTPRMPALLDGFMNLGGQAIAIVNLARLFALPEAASTLYTPLLLLRANPVSIALKVERVLGIVPLSKNATMPLGEHCASNDCAQGVAFIEDRAVVLLSPEKILFNQERNCLTALLAVEQQRLDAIQAAAT